MNQVLHIFSKDIRHLWKEIAISFSILAIYVWRASERWDPENMFAQDFSQLAEQLVPFLLVFSWWVLLIRAIQDERLVGDRQFWVTRPYRWVELFSSKILFALVFIHLPLLICQLIMLRLAGFAALPYLGGLLSMHLELLVVLLLWGVHNVSPLRKLRSSAEFEPAISSLNEESGRKGSLWTSA